MEDPSSHSSSGRDKYLAKEERELLVEHWNWKRLRVEYVIQDLTHQWQVEPILSVCARVWRYPFVVPWRWRCYGRDSSECVLQGRARVRNDSQQMMCQLQQVRNSLVPFLVYSSWTQLTNKIFLFFKELQKDIFELRHMHEELVWLVIRVLSYVWHTQLTVFHNSNFQHEL